MGISLDKIFSLFYGWNFEKKKSKFCLFLYFKEKEEVVGRMGKFHPSLLTIEFQFASYDICQPTWSNGRTDGRTGFCMCVWVCVRTTDKREKREIERERETHKSKSFKFIWTIVFLMKFNLKKKTNKLEIKSIEIQWNASRAPALGKCVRAKAF